jgi:branched-chain amino acid transport system substrate-binding protein
MLSAAWATNPDVIISGGYTGDMVVIAKQAAELNIKPKMLAFLLGPTSPGFVDSVGAGSEGVLEPVQWSANMTYKDDLFGMTSGEYAARFEKEYGYRPDYHPPQSSAAMIVYHRAIEKAGSLDPKKVRDAIAATDIMTFYGPIRFNERGQNIAKGMGVVQIQGGAPKMVYPTQYKEADLVYPRQ